MAHSGSNASRQISYQPGEHLVAGLMSLIWNRYCFLLPLTILFVSGTNIRSALSPSVRSADGRRDFVESLLMTPIILPLREVVNKEWLRYFLGNKGEIWDNGERRVHLEGCLDRERRERVQKCAKVWQRRENPDSRGV